MNGALIPLLFICLWHPVEFFSHATIFRIRSLSPRMNELALIPLQQQTGDGGVVC